ncbi:hypothetical protein EXIGLDRAFT_836458 [Exidia glandulosa HHB12029]|uniref:BTB domain-containing protein n=1 Tax=Exidia glandulosa HHB12029 TaxID=1314781 RepID=A0A166AJE7_EXIGL|nr:hypothetical protein EXIGLDRAFT_836458 [Exidia glandulosa HHB12029]
MNCAICSCSPVTRCDEFWFNDGNLVLQVQHTQYKVHRSLMSNRSDFFRDMLTLPCTTEGTEAAPLFLPDVGERHFTVFLKFLYSQWGDDLKFTTDNWMYVVRVAHRFQFTSALRVAMGKCDDEEPDTKLYWAEQLGLAEWEVPARRAAVLAFDLNLAELSTDLPAYMAIWIKIYRAREAVAHARLANLRRCVKVRDARNQVTCQHLIAALGVTLPRTSRQYLKATFDAAIAEGSSCKECMTFKTLTQESLLSWLPKEEDEFRIIDESWCPPSRADKSRKLDSLC